LAQFFLCRADCYATDSVWSFDLHGNPPLLSVALSMSDADSDEVKESYSWSYAPTNRAACRGACGGKIPKGAIRLCVSIHDGHIYGHDSSTNHFYRLDCVTNDQIDKITAAVGGLENVSGFGGLASDDQAKVLDKASPNAMAKDKVEPNVNMEPKNEAKALAARALSADKGPPLALQHTFCDKAKEHNFDAIKTMLEEDMLLINCQPAGRWSALHQFAAAADLQAVKFLLERGADKQAKTKDGQTPSEVAANATIKKLLFPAAPERATPAKRKAPEPAKKVGAAKKS